MILDNINSPNDLKNLDTISLTKLAEEIRQAILNRTSKIGGHVGSNLGMVETTIALHYVFSSPIDKIIFDVSHQCYTHKILTGRKESFLNPKYFKKISGFTNPIESNHDIFNLGHCSTSISMSCGLAKARDLNGGKENIIAIIGDGSLSGGEAFEGLNNLSNLNSNLIIIVNDNGMSIAKNDGAICYNLEMLRNTNGTYKHNIFKAFGLDYYYIKNGNNISDLINIFSKVKDTNHPTVIHINTLKGKGYKYAEDDKELWHSVKPFDIQTGKIQINNKMLDETFTSITEEYLLKKCKNNRNLAVITPAIPMMCGFTKKFREELGNQYIDVGISEEHAISFAAGIVKNGGKAIVGMHSSFIQRSYDQISQDLAINKIPAVILIFRGGISCTDQTHLGIFDISLINSIPNTIYISPTCKEEYVKMLDWSLENNETSPILIRVPSGTVTYKENPNILDYLNNKKYIIENSGSDICIIASGNLFNLGIDLKNIIYKLKNINATLINPIFLNILDYDTLNKIKEKHNIVITLEDGIIDGGFGEKISKFYTNSKIKVLNYGAKKEFTNKIDIDKLYSKYRLNCNDILRDIDNILRI